MYEAGLADVPSPLMFKAKVKLVDALVPPSVVAIAPSATRPLTVKLFNSGVEVVVTFPTLVNVNVVRAAPLTVTGPGTIPATAVAAVAEAV